jgi:hypothetical protein
MAHTNEQPNGHADTRPLLRIEASVARHMVIS